MKYSIRRCRTLDELQACVELQQKIWGYNDHDVYPLRLFVNMQKIGGHVLGAFCPGGEIAGFVAALPGRHGRKAFLYSLVLGVRPGHENQGLGRRLKLEQRKLALQEGISLIEWTFDPLRAKNSFLNIERLGAIVRRYVPSYYGRVDSRLQLGLPSDRLIAEWHLKSARVKRAIDGKPVRVGIKKPAATVEIPVDLDALFESDPERAKEWQARVRAELLRFFKRGFAITGFERAGDKARFLLDRL